jgi:SAM-dependent methyltransferase
VQQHTLCPVKERLHTSLFDPESPTETARLMLQHRMLTEGMHGVFPERRNLDNIQTILDVGCGPGGWALDVAHTYPDRRVIGIDINATVIAYAQAQAIAQRLSNVSFCTMDALRPLHFVEGMFDLVNVRAAVSFIPSVQWMTFLQYCLRVLRPGGILRVTEAEIVNLTNGEAVEKIHSWAVQVLHIKGYGFSVDGSHLGITTILGDLMKEVGCQNIQSKSHLLDFSAGTALHDSQYQNYMVWTLLSKAVLLHERITTEEDFDQVYQQMLAEMQMPQFRGLWSLLTVWGEKTRVFS